MVEITHDILYYITQRFLHINMLHYNQGVGGRVPGGWLGTAAPGTREGRMRGAGTEGRGWREGRRYGPTVPGTCPPGGTQQQLLGTPLPGGYPAAAHAARARAPPPAPSTLWVGGWGWGGVCDFLAITSPSGPCSPLRAGRVVMYNVTAQIFIMCNAVVC